MGYFASDGIFCLLVGIWGQTAVAMDVACLLTLIAFRISCAFAQVFTWLEANAGGEVGGSWADGAGRGYVGSC